MLHGPINIDVIKHNNSTCVSMST